MSLFLLKESEPREVIKNSIKKGSKSNLDIFILNYIQMSRGSGG